MGFETDAELDRVVSVVGLGYVGLPVAVAKEIHVHYKELLDELGMLKKVDMDKDLG